MTASEIVLVHEVKAIISDRLRDMVTTQSRAYQLSDEQEDLLIELLTNDPGL